MPRTYTFYRKQKIVDKLQDLLMLLFQIKFYCETLIANSVMK